MRTPEEWADAWFESSGHSDDGFKNLIRAIQSDASRSAARSERERCAALCDQHASAMYSCREGLAGGALSNAASEIRALPEVPAGPDVPDEKGDA